MSSAGDPFFAKSSKSPHWTYERTTYYPWFTIIVSVFELIVLFLEFAQNGGIEKTLWANVNRSTLLSLGGMSAHLFGFTSPSDVPYLNYSEVRALHRAGTVVAVHQSHVSTYRLPALLPQCAFLLSRTTDASLQTRQLTIS